MTSKDKYLKPPKLAATLSASSVSTGGSTVTDSSSESDDDDDAASGSTAKSKSLKSKQMSTNGDTFKVVSRQPGMGVLKHMDHFIVKQKLDLFGLEVLCDCRSSNAYDIFDASGQKCYTAYERSPCLCKLFCGSSRPFHIEVMDSRDKPAFIIHRYFRCKSCFCPCYLQKMMVETPERFLLGRVVQLWSCLRPIYAVQAEDGSYTNTVEGMVCHCTGCREADFVVRDYSTKQIVGRVSKTWPDLTHKVFRRADLSGISFPQVLDEKSKATLLAALFLIDYLYFDDFQPGTSDTDER